VRIITVRPKKIIAVVATVDVLPLEYVCTTRLLVLIVLICTDIAESVVF